MTMKISSFLSRIILLLVLFSGSAYGQQAKPWMMMPFSKPDSVNPILSPRTETVFDCPMRKVILSWESNHVFNPAAVVYNNKVYVLYRAEDTTGRGIGGHTSRIGLAVSRDGLHFVRNTTPVIYPANDAAKEYEWDGGCEDPRIVKSEDGVFVVTYTMWDKKTARIGVATSKDLVSWTKHGPAFAKALNGKFKDNWSKSGSIICQIKEDQLIAAKINGKYWMYWGDVNIHLASSTDLINWEPVTDKAWNLNSIFTTRPGKFDSDLVEPGPPAIVTKKGIVFLYNSRNSATNGDTSLPANTYAAGQILLDYNDPSKVLDRCDNYFLKPEKPYELTGQYAAGTVFVEGMVYFNKRWLLYYGTADSKVAVATYSSPE